VALAIPSNAHVPGDTGPGHVTVDHDNIADVLGLLAGVLAQLGGTATTPPAVGSGLPGGNAAALTALSAMLAQRTGYFPWQFRPEAYGAKGNGKVITDAQMTSGSSLLNSAAQASFTAADIGKSVLVSCAGGGTYSPLGSTATTPCTITAVNSATQAVLSVNASSTTPGNSICGYATDDTAAIRAAQAAAVAYAQASQGSYAEIIFGAVIYGVAGVPVIGGTTAGNAQIPLPICAGTAEKIIIVYTGATKTIDQSLMHWLQTAPQSSGSVLMCLQSGGTNDGTNGPASMLGGPFAGYGGDLGSFTNMMPVIDGLQLLVPYNSTVGGFDFFGCAEAVVINGSCMAMAIVPAAPPYPNITSVTNISNQYTFGLRMPCTGNNDRCDVQFFSCEGLCYGIMPSEHCCVLITRCIYCITGIEFYSGNGVTMPHAARVYYASVEGGTNALGFFDGLVRIDVDTIDAETVACMCFDPSNRGQGRIGIRTDNFGYMTASFVVNSGTGLEIRSLDNTPGPVTSGAPAAPATTVAQVNAFYRDAFVTISAVTSISAVSVDATALGLAAGAGVAVGFFVPSGHSWKATYSGTLTVKWVLM
jgi:hypothetical protein